MLGLQVLLEVREQVVRVVAAFWSLVILAAPARVQRSVTGASHAPTVESRQEVVTPSVLGVDIHAVALGTATRARC